MKDNFTSMGPKEKFSITIVVQVLMPLQLNKFKYRTGGLT